MIEFRLNVTLNLTPVKNKKPEMGTGLTLIVLFITIHGICSYPLNEEENDETLSTVSMMNSPAFIYKSTFLRMVFVKRIY